MRPGYIVEDFPNPSSGYGNLMEEKKSPLQCIHEFCIECQGGHRLPWRDARGGILEPSAPHGEVKDCRSATCWLHPYRTGHGMKGRANNKGNTEALKKYRRDKEKGLIKDTQGAT